MTPKELGTELGVDPKRIRDILREWLGTLESQARGKLWILSRAEADYVRRAVRHLRTC